MVPLHSRPIKPQRDAPKLRRGGEKFIPQSTRVASFRRGVRWRAVYGLPFVRNSAIRALTSRLTRADGSGLVSGNRIVPFEVSYPFSSAAWARLIAAVIGYRLL